MNIENSVLNTADSAKNLEDSALNAAGSLKDIAGSPVNPAGSPENVAGSLKDFAGSSVNAASSLLTWADSAKDFTDAAVLFLKKVGERQREIAFALRDKQEVVVRHVRFMVHRYKYFRKYTRGLIFFSWKTQESMMCSKQIIDKYHALPHFVVLSLPL